MRNLFWILFLVFVTLIAYPGVTLATDSEKNSTLDPVGSTILASSGDMTDVTRLLKRDSATTNDVNTDVDRKDLFLDIMVLANTNNEERSTGSVVNIGGMVVDKIFKGIGKVVGRARADRWRVKPAGFIYTLFYKAGYKPDAFYARAKAQTNPGARARYKRAVDNYAAFWNKKEAARVPQP